MKRTLDQMNGRADHASDDTYDSVAPASKRGFSAAEPDIPESAASVEVEGRGRIKKKGSACTECRKVKMKCESKPGMEICARCSKNGLECVFNQNVRSLLAQDTEWKVQFREEIDQLRETVNALLARIDASPSVPKAVPSLKRTTSMSKTSPPDMKNMAPPMTISPINTFETPKSAQSHVSVTNQPATGMNMTRENSPETAEENNNPEPEGSEDTIVAEPMGLLYEVTRLRNLRNKPRTRPRPLSKGATADDEVELDDFISRGSIEVEEAEELYQYFVTSLNHYLWVHVEYSHPDLTSVRRSSSLLAACILTAAALHLPNKSATFDRLYSVFVALVSESMFDRYHSLDDIKALCIGAFWFSDASWKLSGHAIRIGTELGLHKSFAGALAGSKEHFEMARLWYMLYVCDHHFSFAYGRPCLIRESYAIRHHEEFLKSPFALPIDFRILSQVSIFQIMSKVDDDFEGRLVEECLDKVEEYNIMLDKWLLLWQGRQQLNAYIGEYPPLGNLLYYHFTKLQLNSLVLRDVSRSKIHKFGFSEARKKFANIAIESAISTLKAVLEKHDLQRALVGGPLYISMMIAFAAVFLLKLSTKWKEVGLDIDPPEMFALVERTQQMLSSMVTGEKHLVYYIAAGLDKMLKKFQFIETREKTLTDIEMSSFWDSVMDRAWGAGVLDGAAGSDDSGGSNVDVFGASATEPLHAAGLEHNIHNVAVGSHNDAATWQDQSRQPLGMMLENDVFAADSILDVYQLLSNQLPS